MTCVEHSSAVGRAFQLSLAPGVRLGQVGQIGSGLLSIERAASINVQNSFGCFGPSGQTREGSTPFRGGGPSLFGPWEFLDGELRPRFGRWPLNVAVG
jgi:hypothetical protein